LDNRFFYFLFLGVFDVTGAETDGCEGRVLFRFLHPANGIKVAKVNKKRNNLEKALDGEARKKA
jgi:hypothetical protein